VKNSLLPKISIVTPSFNQGDFLEETIRSVLEQDYPDLEYIIMDGGSTDRSVDIIRKYADRIAFWVSEPDAGQSDALRKGFSRATGEVFGWLNSDDTLAPGTLRRVGKFFAAHPDVDLTYGNMYLVDPSGRRLYTAYPLLDLRILVYENRFIPQQAMFWRRGLYERVGGVNPELRFAMDFELTVRFLRAGAQVAKIHKPLANFRFHPDAKSSTIRHVGEVEARDVLARFFPGAEPVWKVFLKKMIYRGWRFLKEPRSLLSAVQSRW
jgi:glycosyltransferase involved in cell wall biosynthesis